MEYISDRISLKQKDNELSIVILSIADKLKNRLMLAWLVLWTVGGVIVFSQYFTITDSNTKVGIMVWMGFWIYFEYKITKAYLWRRNGKEIIKLRNNKLLYVRSSSGKGKNQTYQIDFIKNLRLIENKDNSFIESLNNSYWVIAGEKLAFDYYGKEVKIGIQLDQNEVNKLFQKLNAELKKRSE